MKTHLSTNCDMEYDDVGRGRLVVLLHAFPLSRAMWRPQIEALQNDYRMIAPDLRGFGGTGGFTEAPAIEQMADDVAALLDQLKISEPVVLGGLSMGGYVALAFARRHPAWLRGVILADTRAEADSDEARANRDQLMEFARNHTGRDVLEQMLPRMVSAETRTRRPQVVEEVRRMAAAQASAGIIGALGAMRNRPDARPVLGAITVPVLVLVGKDDILTPPDVAEHLAMAIGGCRPVVIPSAGHLSNLEQPEAFTAAVRSFLESLPPDRPSLAQ